MIFISSSLPVQPVDTYETWIHSCIIQLLFGTVKEWKLLEIRKELRTSIYQLGTIHVSNIIMKIPCCSIISFIPFCILATLLIVVIDWHEMFNIDVNYRFGTDPTPVGVERMGHVRGGVQRQKLDGFTKSTAVNVYGCEPSSTQVLGSVEPYVGRLVTRQMLMLEI